MFLSSSSIRLPPSCPSLQGDWGPAYACKGSGYCYRQLNVWFSEPTPDKMVNKQTTAADNKLLPYT